MYKTINNNENIIQSLQIGGNIHKKVRKHLYNYLKPGITLLDIAKIIELKTIELSKYNNTINKGIGFPASLSLNNCAAHFHPESNSNIAFNKNDVLKIDFGIENNEWIIDSAFTFCFDEKYNNLLNAVKDATNTGIENAGIDVIIGEWASTIQEVMESYEITLNGKTKRINTITNLGGHNITKGIIHGGIFLPPYKNTYSTRFKEGVYAIETFGSTGENYVFENGESTLYRINPNPKPIQINLNSETLNYYNKIKYSFETLPFTNRYIESVCNYKSMLNTLVKKNLIYSYPPLCVSNENYTAQYEHTLYIGKNKKIVFSQDTDY